MVEVPVTLKTPNFEVPFMAYICIFFAKLMTSGEGETCIKPMSSCGFGPQNSLNLVKIGVYITIFQFNLIN